jgi:hypothetical protein
MNAGILPDCFASHQRPAEIRIKNGWNMPAVFW